MRDLLIAVAIIAIAVVPALAQEQPPAYLDDRSTAERVVASFYNAIDRQEYLRAYSYFGPGAEVSDYAKFKAGYLSTSHVTLQTGSETSEGAAGSIYYTLPVAIDALNNDGTHQIFAGCYTLRLSQPSVQDAPPFVPLHIDRGALKPAKGTLDQLVTKPCPES